MQRQNIEPMLISKTKLKIGFTMIVYGCMMIDVRQDLVKDAKDRVESLILSRPNPHLLECSVDYRGFGLVEFTVD